MLLLPLKVLYCCDCGSNCCYYCFWKLFFRRTKFIINLIHFKFDEIRSDSLLYWSAVHSEKSLDHTIHFVEFIELNRKWHFQRFTFMKFFGE